jgi:hypothetical protein
MENMAKQTKDQNTETKDNELHELFRDKLSDN